MDYSDFQVKIKNVFSEKLALELSNQQCQAFFDFMNLLIEKNKVMNLTAITEPDEIIMRHFLDSCFVLNFVKDFEGKAILDIGTGAGFPGIPLAIICEKTRFTLSDTLGKRIIYLSEVLELLKLSNVELIKARAEDLAHDKKYREKYDYVLSRGVARMPVLSEYSLPFLKIGGKMLSYKMDDCDDEIDKANYAIKILGGMFHVKHSYKLYDAEPQRAIVEINKIKNTALNYPRKAGTPSKTPL